MKCNLKACDKDAQFKFGKRIYRCAEHSEELKQVYSRYTLIVSEDGEKAKRLRAPRSTCSYVGCNQSAMVMGKGDRVYCSVHGVSIFTQDRLKPKEEAAESLMKQMEQNAIRILLLAEDEE